MMHAPFSNRQRLDRIGLTLSGLCLVHCLAGLFLVASLGLGGQWLLAPAIHRIGLALAICIGAATIGWGAVRHRRTGPLAVASVGLALMGGALFVDHGLHEAALTVGGVLLVAIGHLINLRHAR